MRITHPFEHCWKLYESSDEELAELWLYEKQRTPPDAAACFCIFCLTTVVPVMLSLILIVMSCNCEFTCQKSFRKLQSSLAHLADDIADREGR